MQGASRRRPTTGMPRYLTALAALLISGCTSEDPHPQSREVLYRQLCASCHGLEGAGDGPTAGALSPSPTDLTRLRSGVPELMKVIDGRRTVRAHGTAAMPVWGEVFEQALIDHPRQRRLALLHVQSLAEYVQGLQKRGG